MQDLTPVVPAVWPYVVKALVGLLITGLGTLILWPIRTIRKEWAAIKKTMSATEAELVLQRTNCLSSLQIQGETQINLLGKVSDTLDGVRLDLAEQTGYLRAGAVPSRRRSKKL